MEACPCKGMGRWLEAGSYLERRETHGWWSSPGLRLLCLEERAPGVVVTLQMNVIAAFTDEGQLPHDLAEDVSGFVRDSGREQDFDGAVGVDVHG